MVGGGIDEWTAALALRRRGIEPDFVWRDLPSCSPRRRMLQTMD
jgi:hypothetical protein